MYSFWIQIANVYNEYHPTFEGCNITKSRDIDNLRTRYNLTGALTFRGSEYNTLLSYRNTNFLQLPIRVINNGLVILQGYIDLNGTYHRNAKTCELSFIQDDLYNKILSNLDYEIVFNPSNFFTNVIHEFTTQLRTRWQAIETGGTLTGFENYDDNGTITPLLWATGTSYVAAQVVGSVYSSAIDNYNQVFVLQTGQSYACIADHETTQTWLDNNGYSSYVPADTQPGTGSIWTIFWDEVEDPHEYNQEYADFTFTDSIWDEVQDQWILASSTTQSTQINFRTRSVFDILADMLTEIDPQIKIFETTSGQSTGYIQYIENNYPNKLYKYWGTYDDEPTIKLSDIITFIQTVHNVDWRMEDRIFVFRHASERPTNVGTSSPYDLTDYFNEDWTGDYIERTSDIAKVSKETFEFNKSILPDFGLIAIEYDNDYEEIKQFATQYITDIKHAVVNQKDNYIICATGTQKTLYNHLGIIETDTLYNGGLAVSVCVFDHYQEGRPFNTYIDWTGIVNLDLIRKRYIEVPLPAPYLIPDIIDQDNFLINATYGDLEIIEISINLVDGFATLKGVK